MVVQYYQGRSIYVNRSPEEALYKCTIMNEQNIVIVMKNFAFLHFLGYGNLHVRSIKAWLMRQSIKLKHPRFRQIDKQTERRLRLSVYRLNLGWRLELEQQRQTKQIGLGNKRAIFVRRLHIHEIEPTVQNSTLDNWNYDDAFTTTGWCSVYFEMWEFTD